MWDRMRPHDRREALFGGRGAVRVWDLTPGTPAPPFAAVLACELEPGASVGAHLQPRHGEVVIGVAGRGAARVGGEEPAVERALEPGSVVAVPRGRTLALENLSPTEPLRYLIVKAG